MAPKPKSTRTKKAKVEVDREENDIAPLSGILVKLPYETLVEILSLCDPQSFARMLRTCKAITGLVKAEEKTLYQKLYHLNLPKNSKELNHPVYSPTKQESLIKFSLKEDLPVKAIYSWKDQFTSMLRFSANGRFSQHCMSCLTSSTQHEIETIDEWRLSFCAYCLAKNLIVPSNLSIHQVTAKDVAGIPTAELKTESIIGGFKQQKFYCAIHLKSLAQEKHGEKYHGPQLLEVDDNDKLQDKDDLVSCATLLLGGNNYYQHLASVTAQCQFDSVGNTLSSELNNQATGRPYDKYSTLKKRPLADILKDYAALVKKHTSKVPVEEGKLPVFVPALNPGPLVPSATSLAAFSRIRRYTETHVNSDGIFYNRNIDKIRSLQEYILRPTESKWKNLTQLLREALFYTDRRLPIVRVSSDWNDVSTCVAALDKEGEVPVSPIQMKRIRLLAQIATIGGETSITPNNIVQLLPGKALPVVLKSQRQLSWAQDYYDSGYEKIFLLMKVYQLSKAERTKALEAFAKAMAGNHNSSTQFSSSLGIELLHSYTDGNDQRCRDWLTDRQKVTPHSRYEDEIIDLMRLMRSSILNSTNIIAAIHKFGRCQCLLVGDGRKCRGECWIDYLPHLREVEEENSEYGAFGDYF